MMQLYSNLASGLFNNTQLLKHHFLNIYYVTGNTPNVQNVN